MKPILGLLLLLITLLPVKAQLNNTMFDQRKAIDPADSNALFLGINTLGFAKNNEYFNDIADGYTLFGYQLNPYLSYHPTANFKVSAGVYLQKDFGGKGYVDIAPTFSLEYRHNDATLIFGNLEGGTSHRLIEPLYDFERVLTDRLENGIQYRVERESLFLDTWVDWQNMIYKGDPEQERIGGGLSLDYQIMNADGLEVWMPAQLVVRHIGGQIDNNPQPLQTYTNMAAGLSVEKVMNGLVHSIRMDNYYVYYKDFSPERLHPFEDGSGWYINLGVKAKRHFEVMGSYWRGHEFISIMGGQLYPSVSSTYKKPNAVEEVRELFIMRLMYNLNIADHLVLSTRVEPYFDLQNQAFEYSYGFYINYSTDFFLLKTRGHR